MKRYRGGFDTRPSALDAADDVKEITEPGPFHLPLGLGVVAVEGDFHSRSEPLRFPTTDARVAR